MAETVKQHYINIQEFMVKDLELKGNELIAYALIYGFSQDGESCFKGSLSYVAKWLNCSKTTAHNILNTLADDGFLEKKEKKVNGVRLCDYKAVVPDKTELQKVKDRKENRKKKEKSERCSKNLNTNSKNDNTHSENYNGRSKNLNEGVQKTGTHNTIDKLDDSKDGNIDDNLKGENINKVNGKVKTCSFREENMDTPKTRFEKYRSMKSEEENMIEQIRDICDSILEKDDADEICNTLEHYFERYTEKTGKIHPILKTETLIDIISKISEYSDTEYFHFERVIDDRGAFIKIIDEFFDGDFGQYTGKRTNWNLPHFMSDGVLDRLAQRLNERGDIQ